MDLFGEAISWLTVLFILAMFAMVLCAVWFFGRIIYFAVMPPDDELDDDGRPLVSYGRKEWQRKWRVRFIAVLIGAIIIVLVLIFR